MAIGRFLDELAPALHDHRPRSRTLAPARPDALSPAQRQVLDLQATVGNAAVARAMRGAAPPQGRLAVQREKAPTWVKEAQKELKSLFPKEKLMQGVVIKDYGDLNATLQGMGYGAWTESATEIYLRDPMSLQGVNKANKRSLMRFVLQHEANHIRQFATANGPPTKWADMLKFEIEAYGNDKKWLAANGKKEIPDKKLRDLIEKGTTENFDHAIEMQKAAAKEKDPEAFLFAEMKKHEFIPQDAAKDPRELYKQE